MAAEIDELISLKFGTVIVIKVTNVVYFSASATQATQRNC